MSLLAVCTNPNPLHLCHNRTMTLLAGSFLGLILTLLPTPALAWCGLNNCGGSTQISAVTVYHTAGEVTVVPVEPDTGETLSVTAFWDALEFAGGGCSCHQTASSSVTVDVDWSDATDSW